MLGNQSIVEKNKKHYVLGDDKGNINYQPYTPPNTGDYYIGVKKVGTSVDLYIALNMFESEEDKSYLTLHKTVRYDLSNNIKVDSNLEVVNWTIDAMNTKNTNIVSGTFLKLDNSKVGKWNNITKDNKYLPEVFVKIGDTGSENLPGNIGLKGKLLIPLTITTKEKPIIESTSGRTAFTFEIVGGKDATVVNNSNPVLNPETLQVSYLGTRSSDSDINSTSGGKTQVSLELAIKKENNKIKIGVLYIVREMQRDKTTLSLFKTFTYDFPEKIPTNDKLLTKAWWELPNNKTITFKLTDSISGQQHNLFYLFLDPDTRRKHRVADIRMKIDGGGSETKTGNIVIKGTAFVDYKIFKEYKVIVENYEQPLNMNMYDLPEPNHSPGIAVIPNNVKNVLCYGMHISGEYASVNNICKKIYDLDKLNKHRQIEENLNTGTYSYSISSSGASEYSKKVEEELSINIAAKYNALSFSNETKKTYSDERYNKESYKFISHKDLITKAQYKIKDFDRLDKLLPFLDKDFLKDLDTLSASRIIELYGTHAMLGIKIGGRLEYNFSYLQSINKSTQIKTLLNTTRLSYNMDSTPGEFSKDKVNSEPAKEKRDKKLADGELKEAIAIDKQIAEIEKKDEQDNDKDKDKDKDKDTGFAGSIEVGYKNSETTIVNIEEEGFTSKAFTIGGNDNLGSNMNSTQDVNKQNELKLEWSRSIDSNPKWCDYVPKTLIPIYELIPDNKRVTRAALKKVYDDHIKKFSSFEILGTGTISYDLHAKGENFVYQLASDADIYSKPNRETYWELTLELVNLTGGQIGVAIWYEVHEGGKNAGKSKLQLRQVIPIKVSNRNNIAIDETVKNHRYTLEGTFVGEYHKYIDATTQAKGCEFIDTDNSTFEVKIDGPGGDKGNIAIKGKLRVPYQYYKYDIQTK